MAGGHQSPASSGPQPEGCSLLIKEFQMETPSLIRSLSKERLDQTRWKVGLVTPPRGGLLNEYWVGGVPP